jgi:hypothetical protein
MAKKRLFMGILVIVLAFGMAVVGCNNGSTDDNDTTYQYLYVTVSDDGGSTYNAIPSNTNHGIGPFTDVSSYLSEGIDGNAHTRSYWFSGIRNAYTGQDSDYPDTTVTEDGDSIIVSGFSGAAHYRVKYTLKN